MYRRKMVLPFFSQHILNTFRTDLIDKSLETSSLYPAEFEAAPFVHGAAKHQFGDEEIDENISDRG